MMVLAINYYGFLFRVGDSDDWGGKNQHSYTLFLDWITDTGYSKISLMSGNTSFFISDNKERSWKQIYATE